MPGIRATAAEFAGSPGEVSGVLHYYPENQRQTAGILSRSFERFDLAIPTSNPEDTKVVSVTTAIQNGAIMSVDNLELSSL